MARDPRSLEQRRDDILDAAAELIVKHGYAGTSLDAICESAGCSKSMIYTYFGDKQGLLSALSEEIVHQLSRALRASDRAHLTVAEALYTQAKRILELVLSDKYVAVLRVIIAEFWSKPQLGHSYHKLGPRAAQQELSEYLAEHAKAGELSMSDPLRAAQDFLALVLWNKLHPRLVGVQGVLSAAEMDRDARHAVECFLRIYGVSATPISKFPAADAATG
mgnify:CR=1 FL=1